MLYSWCPQGGAVSHRAPDLYSAEETRGYCDPQETSGKYIYDTHTHTHTHITGQVYIQ